MKKYSIYLCSVDSLKSLNEHNPEPIWCVNIVNDKNYQRHDWVFSYKKWKPDKTVFNVPMAIREADYIVAYPIVGTDNTPLYNELMYANGLQIEEYKTKKKAPQIVIVDERIELQSILMWLGDNHSRTFKDAFKWIEQKIEMDIEDEHLNAAFG